MSRIIRVPKRVFLVVVSALLSVLLRMISFAFGSVRESTRGVSDGSSGKQLTLLFKAPRPRTWGRFKRARASDGVATYYRVQLAALQPFIKVSRMAAPMPATEPEARVVPAAYVSAEAATSTSPPPGCSPPPPPPPPALPPPNPAPPPFGGGGSPPPFGGRGGSPPPFAD
jgi:hypothetical protein